MNNNPSNTLLIATYNWPEALSLILKSVAQQSILPDEVIIADDGSDNRTRTVIEEFQRILPVPLHHEWQPDNGFQKTIILNKALAKAKGDYIIQVDGDVLLHKKFIEDHLRFAKPNSFVAGTRVIMNQALTKEVIRKGMLTIPFFAKTSLMAFVLPASPALWRSGIEQTKRTFTILKDVTRLTGSKT